MVDSKLTSIVHFTTPLIFIIVQCRCLGKNQKFQVQNFLSYKERPAPHKLQTPHTVHPFHHLFNTSKGLNQNFIKPRESVTQSRLSNPLCAQNKVFPPFPSFLVKIPSKQSSSAACIYPHYACPSTTPKRATLVEGMPKLEYLLYYPYIQPPEPSSIINQPQLPTATAKYR